ncbi:uncharacterized protein LOC135467937 [Liolophura sinensis]|uniref:uncharacterized protein LOC135467937 n=1 Tax=Liolophura sinensis TaxID=3198878 RepID=UPI003158ABAD
MYIPYAGTNQSAKMEFQMDNNSNQTLMFWVLETDYTNYAVAYGCLSELNETTGFCPDNKVNGWAFARYIWEPLSDYVDWRIDHRLDYFCSNVSHYEMIVHNKERCRFPESKFWLPQPAFNISKFMGMWYEQEFIPLDAYQVPRVESDQNVRFSLRWQENGSIHLARSARKAMNNSRCFNESRYLIMTNTPGKFFYKKEADAEEYDFIVAFTDYTSLTFAVGCVDKPVNKNSPCQKYLSWVGTRSVNASGHNGLWLQRLMALHDIDDRLFYPTIQNHTCNYVPPTPPAPNTPATPTCTDKSTNGGAPLYMHETLVLMTAAIMTLVWKEM